MGYFKFPKLVLQVTRLTAPRRCPRTCSVAKAKICRFGHFSCRQGQNVSQQQLKSLENTRNLPKFVQPSMNIVMKKSFKCVLLSSDNCFLWTELISEESIYQKVMHNVCRIPYILELPLGPVVRSLANFIPIHRILSNQN